MFFGVLKAAVPLGVHARPQQGLCPVISLRFLCSHAREYLFSRTCACCLHWRAPSCFLDVPMQHALAFIGEVVTGSLPRHQDLIGACHMHTCVHKKIPRHMKLRAHTRNTANSPGKSAFSSSLQRQRDASFAHCQGHNGWRLACRMHVYAGGSDHMLYQHITVLTPGITASCSSIPPSFLAFIVVIVLFRCFLMLTSQYSKSTSGKI